MRTLMPARFRFLGVFAISCIVMQLIGVSPSACWSVLSRAIPQRTFLSADVTKKECDPQGANSNFDLNKQAGGLAETYPSYNVEKQERKQDGDPEEAYPKADVRPKENKEGTLLPPCPKWPPGLAGAFTPQKADQDLEALEDKFSFLKPGGDYQPPDCQPKDRTAVIIPCTNRWHHLPILLNILIPLLVRQQASFTIYVVEMAKAVIYNKALTLNAAVLESLRRDNYTCFIFHDVDLIPLNDHNLYRCGPDPRHLAVGISKFHYKLPYEAYIGGTSALARDQLFTINGFSNEYFGWGGEDDDFYYRIKHMKMSVSREHPDISRYDMILHKRDVGNQPGKNRRILVKKATKRMAQDGLNTAQQLYKVERIILLPLYTLITVSANMTDVLLRREGQTHQVHGVSHQKGP